MSEPSSGNLFSSMEQIKQLTEEAIAFIIFSHRHKDITFSNCPECKLKSYLLEIQKEIQNANGKAPQG